MVLSGKKNTSKFNGILSNENFIKNYNEDSDIGCIIKIDVEFLKRLHSLHNDLPFVPARMKTKQSLAYMQSVQYKQSCRAHKNFKTIIKSWINFKESAQNN